MLRARALLALGRTVEGRAAYESVSWLALCGYTWIAPGIFQRALAKELEQVQFGEQF